MAQMPILIILAGGASSRMWPLREKSLLRFGTESLLIGQLQRYRALGFQEAIIVTNPEVSSVRDSDRILGIIQAKSRRAQSGGEPVKEHLLITRYSPKRVEAGEMLSYTDVQEILRIPLIGVIPESESVLHASNQGNPAIHFKGTDVAEAYEDVIARFLGDAERPLRFIDYEKPGLLKRIFGAK